MQKYYRTVVQTGTVNQGVLKLSSQQAAALDLSDQTTTNLYAGQKQMQITISISDSNKNKNHFYLSSSDLKKLRLHSGHSYGVSKQADGIHLGPVVGIMAEGYPQSGKPFGMQSFFIKQLIMSARELGEICYGFTPSKINWVNKTVTGYTWIRNRWVKAIFPLPDVVYPRERGYSSYNQSIRKRLEAEGCKFLNPNLIGKWQTYQILSKNPALKNALPDTMLVRDFRPVERMLKRYHNVYMKPVAGCQGRNIIKVRKSGSSYLYKYQMNNRMHEGTASSLAGLKSSLRRVMGKQNYIVQQQINLLSHDGNILDVRVMMQKDNSGNFSVTGKACRVGRPGSITSNISAGGHGRTLDFILARHFSNPEQRESIANEVEKVAMDAAQTLDKTLGNIGELGIDIGIDIEGRVWFIEANLRPARQIFLLIKEPAIRKQTIVKPLLYCRSLAGFPEL